jgi:hypothetical protein
MNLFYVATTVKVGNGKKTPFWKTRWLNGAKPRDMAPPVIPKRKKWNVNQALNANISKINMEADFKMDHI